MSDAQLWRFIINYGPIIFLAVLILFLAGCVWLVYHLSSRRGIYQDDRAQRASGTGLAKEIVKNKLATVEIKAYVPAMDFEVSKRFYADLGFEQRWCSDELAYFNAGRCSFLLQRFYEKEHADNFMMHMLVEDVEAWWQLVKAAELDRKYGTRLSPPADRQWGIRDFTVQDPAGVCWRIGQNIELKAAG